MAPLDGNLEPTANYKKLQKKFVRKIQQKASSLQNHLTALISITTATSTAGFMPLFIIVDIPLNSFRSAMIVVDLQQP